MKWFKVYILVVINLASTGCATTRDAAYEQPSQTIISQDINYENLKNRIKEDDSITIHTQEQKLFGKVESIEPQSISFIEGDVKETIPIESIVLIEIYRKDSTGLEAAANVGAFLVFGALMAYGLFKMAGF